MLGEPFFVHNGGARQLRMVETKIVYQHISHHIHLAQLCSFPIGDAVVAYSGGEKNIAQPVYHQAVDFLGHTDVEATGAGRNVRKHYSLLLGNDGSGHSRCKIVYYNNCLRL